MIATPTELNVLSWVVIAGLVLYAVALVFLNRTLR